MSTHTKRSSHTMLKLCVLYSALPVMLDVVRGPDRLPADEEIKEMLRGKLRILQVDSSKVNALFKVQLITHTRLLSYPY